MQEALPIPVTVGDPIEIVLPFLPKSKNELANMPPLHRRANFDRWKTQLEKHLGDLGPFQALTVEIELWFSSRRRRDWQNYALHTINLIADVLVRKGVIPDDTPAHFRVLMNGGVTFRVDTNPLVPAKQRQRTVLRLTPEEM